MKAVLKFILVILIIAVLVFTLDYFGFIPGMEKGQITDKILGKEPIPQEEMVNNQDTSQNLPEEGMEPGVKQPGTVEQMDVTQQRPLSASEIKEEINYRIAVKLGDNYGIPVDENILASHVEKIFKSMEPQTLDTVNDNPKSIVAAAGYKSYGRTLALDYVMGEIVDKLAIVNEDDLLDKNLYNQLLDKYGKSKTIMEIEKQEDKFRAMLQMDANARVADVIKNQIKVISDEIYNDVLKEYNPVYYNALLKGEVVDIPYDAPSTDVNVYNNQITTPQTSNVQEGFEYNEEPNTQYFKYEDSNVEPTQPNPGNPGNVQPNPGNPQGGIDINGSGDANMNVHIEDQSVQQPETDLNTNVIPLNAQEQTENQPLP